MTVLFISHKYPPAVGGMENQSFHLIQGVSAMLNTHQIIFERKEPVWIFFLKLRHRVKKKLEMHPEISHVHLNDGLLAAFCFLLMVNFKGRKVLVTLHGLDVVFPLGIYQKNILPKMLRKIDKIICVSKATQEACIERNVDPNKIVVIQNGVDTSMGILGESSENNLLQSLHIDTNKDIILLTLGRPVRRKGFVWFAKDVVPLLPDNIKMVHIGHISAVGSSLLRYLIPGSWLNNFNLFMGATDDGQALASAQAKNPDRVVLVGRLSDLDRDYLITVASAVVMPNIKVPGDMEGFGLVALEAAVRGKTVFVADLEGLKDAIIDGKNGFRIPSGDARTWADNIQSYLAQPTLQPEDIRSFTIQNYSWDLMCERYVAEIKGRDLSWIV